MGRRYKVAIIGSDIAALLTAYFLATEYDTSEIVILGGGVPKTVSSRLNAPMTGLYGTTPKLASMAKRSLEIWDQLPARLEADLGITRQGHLMLARHCSEMHACRRRGSLVDFLGGCTKTCDPSQIRALLPGLAIVLKTR